MVTKRKITRKVISRLATSKEEVKEKKIVVEQPVSEPRATAEEGYSNNRRSRRECLFCQNKSVPSYIDLVVLRRFLTDRAKIVAKERSGVCAKHQRGVTKNIKYARHLSLLPFVPKV